ncbi:LON peptidase substrate-binding domain-containing protein [Sphingomonas jatrophae]|uniref:Lon N-terminal domain-containing protein n=1 Tax=Sphingomonas jatrophae TaxID=1166337 RepID=A0A1I6M789_9SPHN|nr:LON peptidase substrate-binding domain-containing protein [Sphingomonas jatrophae]SFS11531.1 hypothetical protein SAMN05192580_3597 [Sphingomonas jatrophae]
MAQRISVFPLERALLFPRAYLPLHIFEPRYRALVTDALARDRRIGMIQPRGPGAKPALFDVGCLGRIADVEALEDGRFNIVLEGITRFRVTRELDVTTAFRQVEAETGEWADAEMPDALAAVVRASVEHSARRFAEARGFAIDWSAVGRLDDETFVNAIAQVAPFDVAAKQALLEAPTLAERAELTMQLLEFFGQAGGGEEDDTTLQ